MEKILFKNDKNLYKANLHCHTTLSDGECSPEEIKAMYKARGYSVVAYTDHNKLENHSYLNDSRFLALNACEVNVNQKPQSESPAQPTPPTRLESPAQPAPPTQPTQLEQPAPPAQPAPARQVKTYHLNLYSCDPNITLTPPRMRMAYEDIGAINAYIQDRINEGYLVCYNHPYWSMQTYEDYSKLNGCFAMEIYNNGCEVTDGYYGYNPQAYDEMLRCGNKLFCFSTDDNHNRLLPDEPDGDSFGGFTILNADSLNYGDIMESLKTGNFYSSQGPDIHEIAICDNKLYVKCSDVNLIVVYTDTRTCYCKKGISINEAEFTLSGIDRYVRVMCRDGDKLDANSNAYWF